MTEIPERKEKVLAEATLTRGFNIVFHKEELVMRMVEAVIEIRRKPDVPVIAQLFQIKELSETHSNMIDDLNLCAEIAMRYFTEEVTKASKAGSGGRIAMGKIEGTMQ